MNPLRILNQSGQSIWLDNLSRTLLREGGLQQLIENDGISGVTSNPSIFQKALAESPYYHDDLARLKASEADAEKRYEALVVPDIQAACDLLLPSFQRSQGVDGYVSLEVSPHLAHDSAATIAAAQRLRATVNRPNLLIKIPGTAAGLVAFEQLITAGVSINITLLFSLRQTVRVFEAYIRGLRQRLAQGSDLRNVKAVASLFLSRVDTLVDQRLATIDSDAAQALTGRAALITAKLAYQRYQDIFHGAMFADLAHAGARPQYLLWASTGTKNPAYSDVKYLEALIGTETINTVPDATLAAFRDHGRVELTLTNAIAAAEADYIALEKIGIDLNVVGETLQVDGLKLFSDAYDKALASS
ncbi:transaldolase [Sulfuriferula multivorans]|uniref:Transaldolase n=1 Tax=Sulfuriferula multivorans TaxID=1559896 RepID=A0A401JA86_9PROT|nr:transaldolase [Sulfuriferula multivorans]GBL44551.1 transaldolase [Sulfuriferula multivorans]